MSVNGIDPVNEFLHENFTQKGIPRKDKQVKCKLTSPGGKRFEGAVTSIKVYDNFTVVVVGGQEHAISERDAKSERTDETASFQRPMTANPDGGFSGSFRATRK